MAPDFKYYAYLRDNFKFYPLISLGWLLIIPKFPKYEPLIKISEKNITIEELSKWEFVLRYHPNYNRSLLEKYIGKEKLKWSSEQSSIADILSMVREGDGISMVSAEPLHNCFFLDTKNKISILIL